jgi:hypothetical protein
MAFSITGKIVGVDRLGGLTPLCAPVVEKADQFSFLAVYADTRPTGFQKGISLADKVLELLVSVRMGFGMQTLDIASGANGLLVEQPPDRAATQVRSFLLLQSLLDFLKALANPASTRLWLTSNIILDNFR